MSAALTDTKGDAGRRNAIKTNIREDVPDAIFLGRRRFV